MGVNELPFFMISADATKLVAQHGNLFVLTLLHAELRDFLCKQLSLFTAKVVTDPLPEFTGGQQPSRFDNRSLAMNPLWLHAVEPGTLGGEPARADTHACFSRLRLA